MNNDSHQTIRANQTDDHKAQNQEQPLAADVARQQLNAAYETSPPNQTSIGSNNITYDRTYTDASYDWQHYHHAWQSYYQQYYQRYYLNQLYTHREQLTEKVQNASNSTVQGHHDPGVIYGRNSDYTDQSGFSFIRDHLLSQVRERAEKIRHSYHFVPIVTALIVGLLFMFLQYNRILFANFQAYISPGSSVAAADTILVDPTLNLNVGPDPKLIIPKINVDANVDYSITTLDTGPIEAGLQDGVVHYNLPGADSYPGQVGNTVLLGHSSNDIFDPGMSKFVFVLLNELGKGDIFYVLYHGTRYTYQVTNTQVIKPTDVAALQIQTTKPLVTLVTCTPIGTDLHRLLVTGEQISPDPSMAQRSSQNTTSNSSSVTIPGSSPTFFDRLFSLL